MCVPVRFEGRCTLRAQSSPGSRSGLNAPAQLQSGATQDIEHGARYFVNVGTTGLPFPGKGGPAVALVDFGDACIRQIPLERD